MQAPTDFVLSDISTFVSNRGNTLVYEQKTRSYSARSATQSILNIETRVEVELA